MSRPHAVSAPSKIKSLFVSKTGGLDWHLLLWGWIRLTLGLTQIGFSLAGLVSFFALGLSKPTYWALGVASGAMILSRLLYHGRSDPRIRKRGPHNGKQ